jgi:flagellar hook-basal body complex protein FliE
MRVDNIVSHVLGAGAPGAVAELGSAKTSAASFADVLGQSFSSALSTIQGGESAAIQSLQGSMAPAKVVEAVMGAQRTLQSALAIRDKVVAAWQEIARMPI